MTNDIRRPGGVIAIAVLSWILGLADLLLAVLILVSGESSAFFPWAVVGIVVLGLVYIAAGFGVFVGIDAARVVVLLGSLVSFATGLGSAVNGQPVFGGATVLVTIAITMLLWTGRGDDWFSRPVLSE